MKAILVVDIPDDIWANKESLKMYCKVWTKYHTNSLKPIPQKKRTDSRKMATTEEVWYNGGYNTCIDEILGEKE